MVVETLGIPGKALLRGTVARMVTHGKRDNSLGTFEQQTRVAPKLHVVLHVVHLTLTTFGKPLLVVCHNGIGHTVCRSQADM